MTRTSAIIFLGLIGLLSPTIHTVKKDSAASSNARTGGSNNRERGSQRANYVGTAVCVSCHENKSLYLHTSHYLTSKLANENSVLGSFRNGSNLLTIIDPTTTAEPGLYFK